MINYKNLGICSQRKDVLSLRAACLKIARNNAPRDTGNLKNNAIYSVATKNGFKIVWDERFAYYMRFVNEGRKKGNNPNLTTKMKRNKDFVKRSIGAILVFVSSYQESFDNNKNFDFDVKNSEKKSKYLLPKLLTYDFSKAKSVNLNRLYAKMQQNQQYVNNLIDNKKEYWENFIPDANTIKGYSTIMPQNKKSYELFDIKDNDIFADILKQTFETED